MRLANSRRGPVVPVDDPQLRRKRALCAASRTCRRHQVPSVRTVRGRCLLMGAGRPTAVWAAESAAVNKASEELERAQEEQQSGPCRGAYDTGEVVRVSDVRLESARWPEFSAAATRWSMAGIAGIPMRLDDQIIGAFNLYSAEPREWSDEDIAVAGVLANVATSYVVNASKLRQQEQLREQLQQALESRIIIEQAKGITAQQHTVSVDQAYQLMRGHAHSNNASLRGVAEAIVAVGLQV
jgi:GAF domain-containing protein